MLKIKSYDKAILIGNTTIISAMRFGRERPENAIGFAQRHTRTEAILRCTERKADRTGTLQLQQSPMIRHLGATFYNSATAFKLDIFIDIFRDEHFGTSGQFYQQRIIHSHY